MVNGGVQTFVIRSGGRTVLVDTGVGNGRDRPNMPAFDQLQTGFLDALADAGVTPEAVDVVVSTHLHGDHVGWNTRLAGEDFVPTFPNAEYLMARADVDFWDPATPATSASAPGLRAESGNRHGSSAVSSHGSSATGAATSNA